MAADFNAGSIEGTLDLRTTPFYAGLTKARRDAAEFERKDIEPDLGLDTKEFNSGVAKSTAALKTLDREKAKPEVELGGVATTLGAIGLVRAALMHLGGTKTPGGGALTAFGLMALKFGGIAAGLFTLTAAAGPATSALVAFATAGVAAMGPLIFSMGLFGATVTGAVKTILEANKAGKDLTGWAGKAQEKFKHLSGAWKDFKKELAPQTFGFLMVAFQGLADLLPKLVPLTRTVTEGMTDLVKQIFALTERPVFERFLKDTERFMDGFLSGAGPLLVDLMKGFMRTFHQMLPVLSLIGDALGDWAESFRRFTRDGGGMERWVQNMLTWLPQLGDLIGSIWTALTTLFRGLSPLASPALLFLTDVFDGLARVDLGPLVQFVTTLLDALTEAAPVLGAVGRLLNELLTVFNSLPGGLQSTLIKLGFAVVVFNKLSGVIGGATTAVRGYGAASVVAGNQAAAAGGKMSAAATRMQRFGGAARTAAGPLGLGLLIHSASMADGKLKTLTTTAAGAAIGFSVGGPWGAAIGGTAGLLYGLSQRGIVAAASLDDLSRTLHPLHQGLTRYSKELIVNELISQGAYKAAATFGISIGDLTRAMMGNEEALKRVAAAKKQFSEGWEGDFTKEQIADNKKLIQLFADIGVDIDKATESARLYREAMFNARKELGGKIPKELVTKIRLADFPKTMEDLAKLTVTHKNLSNKQIKLLIKTFGLEGSVKELRWWENIVAATVKNAGNVKPSKKWLDLLAGDLGHGKRITETGMLGINGIINTVTGKARPNFEPFSRALVGDLRGLEARAGSGGTKIGNAMANGISAALRNALNRIVFGATWLVDSALGAAKAAAGAGGGRGGSGQKDSPRLASGGVVTGPMRAILGDNPGGREAVIPLDKYDLPLRGDLAAIAGRGVEIDQRIVGLLSTIADLLSRNPDDTAEALDSTLGKHSEASLRKFVVAARSA